MNLRHQCIGRKKKKLHRAENLYNKKTVAIIKKITLDTLGSPLYYRLKEELKKTARKYQRMILDHLANLLLGLKNQKGHNSATA